MNARINPSYQEGFSEYACPLTYFWWSSATPSTFSVSPSYSLHSPSFPQIAAQASLFLYMRNLSACEIVALEIGCFPGNELLGYYEKGDTPCPIKYFLSNTVNPDDGGSI
ncbi:hypothetical protein [Sphingobacterium multivorum]|uniref:hypothetical protein n=1 Tax=Sphingobacterium multivorum TaxID=28454 RepID=UPI0031BA544F